MSNKKKKKTFVFTVFSKSPSGSTWDVVGRTNNFKGLYDQGLLYTQTDLLALSFAILASCNAQRRDKKKKKEWLAALKFKHPPKQVPFCCSQANRASPTSIVFSVNNDHNQESKDSKGKKKESRI